MNDNANKSERQKPSGPVKVIGMNNIAPLATSAHTPNNLPLPTTIAKQKSCKSSNVCGKEQAKLFEHIADFAIDTVLGWVSGAYKLFTKEIMRGTLLPILLSHFADEYFNKCACLIYSRTDLFINEKFDKMLASANEIPEIEESGYRKYDPLDILHIIVALSMQLLINMKIGDIIGENYATTMEAVRSHLKFVAAKYNYIAVNFRGCNCDKEHTPVTENEKVFKIEIKKAVMQGDGTVDIKDNWFDDV